MRYLLCAATLSCALVGAACHSSGGGLGAAVKHSQGLTTDTANKATVKIENNGFQDADIFIMPESGARFRIGMANGHSTTVLVIPSFAVPGMTTVRFVANPIGGGEQFRSDQVTIEPGDEVTLILPIT